MLNFKRKVQNKVIIKQWILHGDSFPPLRGKHVLVFWMKNHNLVILLSSMVSWDSCTCNWALKGCWNVGWNFTVIRFALSMMTVAVVVHRCYVELMFNGGNSLAEEVQDLTTAKYMQQPRALLLPLGFIHQLWPRRFTVLGYSSGSVYPPCAVRTGWGNVGVEGIRYKVEARCGP